MPSRKILFVDDDPNYLASIQRTLRNRFSFVAVPSGKEALRALEHDGPFAVIVADMSMPEMNGIDLLEVVKTQFPSVVRIMLTGISVQRCVMDAVNRGNVFKFLFKPCTPESLTVALDAALKKHEEIAAQLSVSPGES
jgi:DNA-binding NtrC family response regulator